MKAKFLVVTSYAFPSSKATANRVHFFIDSIIKKGIYDLTVISSGIDATSSISYYKNIIEKNKIKICHIEKLTCRNIFLRAIMEIIHILKISVKVILLKPNFLIFTIPSPMLLFLSLVCKKNSFGIDIRDASWEYLRRKNLIYLPFCLLLEKLLYIACHRAKFITVTNSFEKESVEKVSGVSSVILKNGISRELFQKLSSKCYVKNKENVIAILYYGNIGIAQHLDCLINATGNHKNYKITLIGTGSALQNLQQLITEHQFSNVTIKKAVPQEALFKEVQKADILYAQIGNAYFTAVPTKIFEYLTYGKHIVLGLPNGPAKNIFSSFDGVHIHSPESTKDALIVLQSVNLSKPVNRNTNLRKLKDSFIREDQKDKLLSLV